MVDGQIIVEEPEEAEPAPPADAINGEDRRPLIRISEAHMHEQATRAERHLIRARVPFYERGGRIVRPISERVAASGGRVTQTAALIEVDKVYLRDVMNRKIRWERHLRRENQWIGTKAPMELSETILARVGEWGISPIGGVISTPTIRPDGSILKTAGYDAATCLYLHMPLVLPYMPDKPTRKDGLAALALLKGLLAAFPFVWGEKETKERNGSLSVALSALITPVVRGAMDVVPAHFARAPAAGTGKSYLFDIVAAIALGHPCPVMAAGRDEAETEKRIGAKALAGHPVICIDNVNGDLGGDALCQLISQPICELRVLGYSKMLRVVNRFCVFGTGNNLRLVGDMTRRSLLCSLDARLERPAERVFVGNPVAAVLANRGAYVAASLTLVRSYIAAGSPKKDGKPMNSFGEWSDRVRAALIWLGEADPVDTLQTASEEDPERQQLAAFLEALSTEAGAVTGSSALATIDIIAKAQDTGGVGDKPRHPMLHAMVQQFNGFGGVNSRKLGKWLAENKHKMIGLSRLGAYWDTNKKVWKWFVETPEAST